MATVFCVNAFWGVAPPKRNKLVWEYRPPKDRSRSFSRRYRGESKSARRAAALRALDRVGLAPWAGHTPAELSGGQQQRVAIARALVTDPEVLLADEPTGNLDSERSVEIMKFLAELNGQGITILMVTHEAEMAAFAKTIVHFKDGLVERIERGMLASGGVPA